MTVAIETLHDGGAEFGALTFPRYRPMLESASDSQIVVAAPGGWITRA